MPDNPSTPPRLDSPFVALHYREFRLFWTGLFISNIGSWMQITATSWLLYELTNSPLQLGLNGIFRAVPTICFGLFAGTIADRYDRKRLLLTTQTVLMVLALLLGVLTQTGLIQVWHIYGLTMISALFRTLDSPARQALYPTLIPRSVLPNATAFNSLLWKGTVLIGPSLAGITIAGIGTDGAFYANGASFLAVIVALLMMKKTSRGAVRPGYFIRDLSEGISYVRSQEIILGVMAMEAVSSIFGLNQAMLTIFARDVLQVGASGLGFLQSARGLGAIVGSGLLLSLRQPRSQGGILLFSALVNGASYAFFGLSGSFTLSLFLLMVSGASDTIWGATRNTILQLQTAEAMRGRVMGIFQLSNRGLSPLGQTQAGLTVPLAGARGATFIGGALVTVVSLLTAVRVPALPRFRWAEDEAVDLPDGTPSEEPQ